MTDIFLYEGEANQNDVRLTDPTVVVANDITGTGTLTSQASTVSGAGISLSTGTGALLAQAAFIAGVGEVTDTNVTGEGSLLAQAAQVSGAGLSTSTGTGALEAQAASLTGTGISESTGTGTLTAQAAAVSGAGVVEWVARSIPYLQEDGGGNYTLENGLGEYILEEVRIVAGASQVSGVGVVIGNVILGGDPDEYAKRNRKQAKEEEKRRRLISKLLRKAHDDELPESLADEVLAIAAPYPSVKAMPEHVLAELEAIAQDEEDVEMLVLH